MYHPQKISPFLASPLSNQFTACKRHKHTEQFDHLVAQRDSSRREKKKRKVERHAVQSHPAIQGTLNSRTTRNDLCVFCFVLGNQQSRVVLQSVEMSVSLPPAIVTFKTMEEDGHWLVGTPCLHLVGADSTTLAFATLELRNIVALNLLHPIGTGCLGVVELLDERNLVSQLLGGHVSRGHVAQSLGRDDSVEHIVTKFPISLQIRVDRTERVLVIRCHMTAFRGNEFCLDFNSQSTAQGSVGLIVHQQSFEKGLSAIITSRNLGQLELRLQLVQQILLTRRSVHAAQTVCA